MIKSPVRLRGILFYRFCFLLYNIQHMENFTFGPQIKKAKEKLEIPKSEIISLMNNQELSEKDRIRLTRVLQIIENYSPKYDLPEKEIAERNRFLKILDFLKTLYRFSPRQDKIPEKVEKKIVNTESYSYLLAEKTISALRELQKISYALEKKEPKISNEQLINQKRSPEIKSVETLDTSITLDYEKKNWGVERILLDGIQNNLPSDSKGEKALVVGLVEDKWIPIKEAKLEPEKIKAVRFIDDGVGFDVKNLMLLYSTKSEEKESRGQFGEGMKMMSAAALREGLEPEIESQDWKARPFSKTISLKDTRNDQKKSVEQLAFEVSYLNDEKPMVGSRTTFWKTTPEFVNEVCQIEDKVLPIRENYQPLFKSENGDIVSRESGNIYAKEIFISKENTLLSYNFNDAETNRDRNKIVSLSLDDKIQKIIEALPNKNIAKTLLMKSLEEGDFMENRIYFNEPKFPSVWVEAFHELFGKDAVLDTDFKPPEILKSSYLNKKTFPFGFKRLLLRSGVKTDKESVPNSFEERILTSLTLEYGKELWKEERILLDAVQNHLPKDSGGGYIDMRFKVKENEDEWRSLSDLNDFKNEDIKEIKISDNGRGYNSQLLGLFSSTKEGTESSGKFGEGLKMLSSAALRNGIGMTLSSRDWVAKPEAVKRTIDGKEVNQLAFNVVHDIKKSNSSSGGSSTTFNNLTNQFIEEFRTIDKKVLSIQNKNPIEKTTKGEILSVDDGLLYVRDILIPSNHKLLFSYHLPSFDIKNRDRSFIEEEDIKENVSAILSEIRNSEVIKNFLYKAEQKTRNNSEEKIEFSTIFNPSNPENWKKAFKEVFGEDATIRDESSQDFNEAHQSEHVGLRTITLPSATFSSLQSLGIETYQSRIDDFKSNIKYGSIEELSYTEKEIIKSISAIDKFLPNNRPSNIRVYELKEMTSHFPLGLSDGKDIHLWRGVLTDFETAADVYYHEKAHHNTGGAVDASKDFRNYLTYTLAQITSEIIKKEKIQN